MARIRTIKPAFFRDVIVANLKLSTRLTFIGLWTYVDDEGRGVDDPRLVKADLWPLDDNYTAKKVDADLAVLQTLGRLCRYEHAGQRYFHVVNWSRHQTISHPYRSSLPPCPFPEHSRNAPESNGNVPGATPEHSISEKEKERNPPTPHGGERRPARRPGGRRSAPEPETAGAALTGLAEEARRRSELAAEACGRCDHGWLDAPTGGLVRCACQVPS